jgi:putative ABC transport system permease protein
MKRDSGAVLLQDIWRDLRHAVRVLSRARGFAASALLTLALGIGATAAVFSIVHTVMLEPLPYDRPERIVTIWETARGGASRNVIAPANFVAWRERSRTLQHFGIVEPTGLTVMIDGQPLESPGLSVSADTFRALGVQSALGRVYTSSC